MNMFKLRQRNGSRLISYSLLECLIGRPFSAYPHSHLSIFPSKVPNLQGRWWTQRLRTDCSPCTSIKWAFLWKFLPKCGNCQCWYRPEPPSRDQTDRKTSEDEGARIKHIHKSTDPNQYMSDPKLHPDHTLYPDRQHDRFKHVLRYLPTGRCWVIMMCSRVGLSVSKMMLWRWRLV